MRKNEPITKIMTTNLITVNEAQPVSLLRKIFEEQTIHHVPVVSSDTLIGIVSWNDFMKVVFGELGNQTTEGLDALLDQKYEIADVMRKDPISITRFATIRDAIRVLGLGDFHTIPVVECDGRLAGMVTTSDMLRFLAELD